MNRITAYVLIGLILYFFKWMYGFEFAVLMGFAFIIGDMAIDTYEKTKDGKK